MAPQITIRLIALEGATKCPKQELEAIIASTNTTLSKEKKSYRYRLKKRVRDYDKLKKEGETPLSGVYALFVGPQAHKIFGRVKYDLKQFHHTTIQGTKILVCCTHSGILKLTKKSFERAWEDFVNSEQ
ncbi:MAG: hypothetical protein LBG52_06475 [Candidatus Peribacteria bacterium]|jgi:hypothetical protein|nr:hypothetical protein [Candidatus Peribacteria bacterium]